LAREQDLLSPKQATSAKGRRSVDWDRDRSHRSHQSQRPEVVGKRGQVWDQAPTEEERQIARPISGFKIARRLKWLEDRSKGITRRGQVDQVPTGANRPISTTRSQIGSTDLTFEIGIEINTTRSRVKISALRSPNRSPTPTRSTSSQGRYEELKPAQPTGYTR